MPATYQYRKGLSAVAPDELERERRRLSGALYGEDLNGMAADVRVLIEDQLGAVRAEQAERAAGRGGAGLEQAQLSR